MGQYYKAINTKKKEYVCPWCIGGGAKLWEWAVNPQGSIFTFLLRKSSATGGGDYGGLGPQIVAVTGNTDLAGIIAKGIVHEGQSMTVPPELIAGRWAGDPLYMIGDYDDSGLYKKAKRYRNISEPLVEQWNQFVDLDESQLSFQPCSSCE